MTTMSFSENALLSSIDSKQFVITSYIEWGTFYLPVSLTPRMATTDTVKKQWIALTPTPALTHRILQRLQHLKTISNQGRLDSEVIAFLYRALAFLCQNLIHHSFLFIVIMYIAHTIYQLLI